MNAYEIFKIVTGFAIYGMIFYGIIREILRAVRWAKNVRHRS